MTAVSAANLSKFAPLAPAPFPNGVDKNGFSVEYSGPGDLPEEFSAPVGLVIELRCDLYGADHLMENIQMSTTGSNSFSRAGSYKVAFPLQVFARSEISAFTPHRLRTNFSGHKGRIHRRM